MPGCEPQAEDVAWREWIPEGMRRVMKKGGDPELSSNDSRQGQLY